MEAVLRGIASTQSSFGLAGAATSRAAVEFITMVSALSGRLGRLIRVLQMDNEAGAASPLTRNLAGDFPRLRQLVRWSRV